MQGTNDDGRRRDHQDESDELLRDAQRETRRANRLVTIPLLILITGAIAMAWWTRSDDGSSDASTDTGSEVAEETAAPEPALSSEAEGGDDGDGGDASADDGDESDGDGTDLVATDTGDDGGDGDGTEAADRVAAVVLPTPPDGAPYVDATLTDNIFVLSGVVPSDAHREILEARAQLAYAPFASSELVVDESVEGAEWLERAPEVIGLLPMITDGTIRLQDDEVMLVGRSPNPEYAARFEQTVGGITGLPVSAPGIEITDLTPPRFVASVAEGKVTLEGELPSEALVETCMQGAALVYGPENVTSTMTIDDGTYTSFWNYTMPGIFQQLAPFPSYQIQVEDGATSGTMQGGILFDLNSAEITPEAAEVLVIGVAILSRDLSLDMTVTGHTDDRGPDELNQRLSLARAESVIDFFVAAGLDPDRLAAEGRGSAEPIASNDTVEGRTQNRRVEFSFD